MKREDKNLKTAAGSAAPAPREDIVVGRNPVMEAVRSGKEIDKLFVQRGASGSITAIVAKCRDRGIPVKEVAQQKLDFLSGGANHQGVAVQIAEREYSTIAEILQSAKDKDEDPFIVVCDGLEDPHNLGAIIRSAECAGAHGVIIPKRRSAGLTAIVDKSSAGAAEHMAIARVPNLPAAIKDIKARGVWVYGTAAGGQSDLWHTDLSGAVALVIGSEGDGMGRLVSESCDFIISLPMRGKVSSLNASTAAAITMYEVLRQRSMH